jgi:hypothetical protein
MEDQGRALMWITVDVERVLRVDRGINVILCNPMLGSGGPQTLVLKLKGSEMTDEVQRLRSALESIADWRNVNISGEHELGLRDIIRSIVDCAVAVLDAPQVPRPAPQPSPCLNCGDPSEQPFCGTCREMGCVYDGGDKSADRAHEAARENLKEAWSALAMIREAVETLAHSGSVKAAEHLDGPTFMHEAEALVAGIMALTSTEPQTAPVTTLREIQTICSREFGGTREHDALNDVYRIVNFALHGWSPVTRPQHSRGDK